jgi:hypothetical protein
VLKRYVLPSFRVLPDSARVLGNEAGGVTPDHNGLRHFAGCLVDHLVAEHDRAALVNRGGMGVRLDDRHGAGIVVRRRRERLVGRLDLVRVQDPLAVVAQGRRAGRRPPEAVDVADLQIRSVDGLQAMRARDGGART